MNRPLSQSAEIDNLEQKIGELELDIESMEDTYSMVCGGMAALLSYCEWHSWMLSIGLWVITTFIFRTFVAKKPFTKFEDRSNKHEE